MHVEHQERWLEQYRFEKYLLDLCILTLERGGVTANVLTRQLLPPVDAWCVPRYPEKTRILPPGSDMMPALRAFVEQHQAALASPGIWLGTWIHPLTRCCHLDITELYAGLDEARREALKRSRVLALYNCKHNQTVYLQAEPSPAVEWH
ncbi:MAG TPA: hypothetical protein VHD63_09760 [Ktedonobacteraceae bacterium]|nr:hypothetical protein [Ktedonobacteraceae bacterium]